MSWHFLQGQEEASWAGPCVEWLMGWPVGWTCLKPLEMGRFQQWLRSHGAHCAPERDGEP